MLRWVELAGALGRGARSPEAHRQSHDLTLFPDRRVEVLLGYDRNKRTGLGFFTEGIPDSVGDFSSTDFLRFATDIRQVTNQYRAGINFRLLGLAVTATQALDQYKEDTAYEDVAVEPVEPAPRLRFGQRKSAGLAFRGGSPTRTAVASLSSTKPLPPAV